MLYCSYLWSKSILNENFIKFTVLLGDLLRLTSNRALRSSLVMPMELLVSISSNTSLQVDSVNGALRPSVNEVNE